MKEKTSDIISDEEIDLVHGSAGFAGMEKRTVVDQALLKCVSGLYQGATSLSIIKKHGLVGKNSRITKKGKAYLWAAFSNPSVSSV